MPISEIIPNPFDKNSSLSDVAKKGELIKEGLSFITLIKNIIFLIVLGIVLIVYFKISTTIVAILIGTEILTTLVAGYIQFKEVKAIYSIDTQDNARSYRRLLITREYWGLIKSIFGMIASGVSIALIFVFFSSEISNFVAQNIHSNLPIKTEWLYYIIFVFVVFRIFKFIIQIIRYNWIKNLKESDDFAQVNQEYLLIEKKLELIKFIPGMSVTLLILFLMGVPFWVISVFAGFMLLIVILSIVELKRIENIKFENEGIDKSVVQHKIESYQNEQIAGGLKSIFGRLKRIENIKFENEGIDKTVNEGIDKSVVQHKIEYYPDEQIAGAVFGIIKTATGFGDIFKPMGVSFLGSGKTFYPENTLLITNYRLLMIQVPVSGGNKIVGKTDYVSQNFFFNRKEIREKGEKILKTSSISQILSLATNDVLFKDIKTVTLNQTKIIIEKLNGEKLAYFFMDREYIEPLKKILSSYLKDRFIVK